MRKIVNKQAMTALAQKFKSIPSGGRSVFAAKDFLELHHPLRIPVGSTAYDDTAIIKLAKLANPLFQEGIAELERTIGDECVLTASDIERVQFLRSRHRFNGTLAIAILQSVRRKHGVAGWNAIRKHARHSWKDTILLDLVEAIGRPTVPSHLLPVFALYEVERRTGEPVENLTREQKRLLGL